MQHWLLKKHRLVLGSSSPRRQELLKKMGLDFILRPSQVDEIYPTHLQAFEISDYLAQLKANALKDTLQPDEILLTSDTVVWHRGKSLEKAENAQQAVEMLRKLAGDKHEVITSVCFTTTEHQITKHHSTIVTFGSLSDEEIDFYVDQFEPFDKAGAYGIQEWIGLVGITRIDGSYTNVVGLPTEMVYRTLSEFIESL
ncbi:MAG: Maf-like protein [Flavobacteriaceae bacterium]